MNLYQSCFNCGRIIGKDAKVCPDCNSVEFNRIVIQFDYEGHHLDKVSEFLKQEDKS